MEEIDKILKFGDEIILGNDRNLGKLKNMIEDYFGGKDQKFFDSIDKKKLQKIIALSEGIRILNDISRAKLDYILHKDKCIKYSWIDLKVNYSPEKLREIREFIIKKIKLDDKQKDDINSWTEWIINENIDWDDAYFESIKKDFRVDINIVNYNNDNPEINVFISGLKKYKKFMEDLKRILI